jgi:hypothetical protein
MGLDQYAKVVKREYNNETLTETITKTEICYWRKHNALHGWMENLYESKGGDGEFNCVNLNLTSEDLKELEEDVVDKDLPETKGFFFGEDTRECDHQKLQTLKFLSKAKKALNQGHEVEYSAWY